jgi:hypothetical protein
MLDVNFILIIYTKHIDNSTLLSTHINKQCHSIRVTFSDILTLHGEGKVIQTFFSIPILFSI